MIWGAFSFNGTMELQVVEMLQRAVCGVGEDVAFLFFKSFSCRCRLMVIGLQSASVRSLIWVEDQPVSSQTARWILQLSTGVIFLGLPLDFFVP